MGALANTSLALARDKLIATVAEFARTIRQQRTCRMSGRWAQIECETDGLRVGRVLAIPFHLLALQAITRVSLHPEQSCSTLPGRLATSILATSTKNITKVELERMGLNCLNIYEQKAVCLLPREKKL